MDIVSLRKEEMRFFRWMDPAKLLDRLELPHYFALAAMIDGDPAGLLIASIKRKELAIEWIYVAPGYRRMGIASAFIKHLVKRMKGKTLVAHLLEGDHSPAEEAAGLFLESRRFEKTPDVYLQWRIDHKKIAAIPMFKDGQHPAGVRKLSELPAYMRQTAVKELAAKSSAITALFAPDILMAFDPEVSCAVLQDGEPAAVLLLKQTGDLIYPISVYASRPVHARQMLLFAQQRMEEKAKNGYILCIDTSQQRAVKLAEQVFGTAGRKLTGSVWKG